jgi:hypothetical protein
MDDRGNVAFDFSHMNTHQIKTLVAERDYILMFMEEVEQTTAFWLWHKYVSKHQHEKAEWGYHFKMFLISASHSSLLSVRKLNDFFTARRKKSDDIKADGYGFKNMTQPLDDSTLKKLNKYLAHMTVPGADLRFRDWNIDDFTRPIYLRAFEFCQHLEKHFLDKKMDAEILKELLSFKRGLLSHIKRVGVSDAET